MLGMVSLLQCCELCVCERAGMPRVFLVSLSIPSSRMEAKQAQTRAGTLLVGSCTWGGLRSELSDGGALERPHDGKIWNHEERLAQVVPREVGGQVGTQV